MELAIVIYIIALVIALIVWIWFIVTMNSMLKELREIRTQVVYLGELGDYITSHPMFDDEPMQK
jgi:hypothetical protein